MTPAVVTIAAIWGAVLTAGGIALRRIQARSSVRRRMAEFDAPADDSEYDERGGFLRRWLFVAGFRRPEALPMFFLATAAFTSAGLASALLVRWSGVVRTVDELLRSVPGGVGEVFLPLAWMSPWMTLFVLGSLPTLLVRARRRRRVAQFEEDLPMTLDLLATLAQAGLGFDAALDRVLAATPPDRTLAQEFRTFQYDLIGGRPRVEALRRLSRRVEVPWFTIFISAVVQAEQVGAGLAGVLQIQADDLRQRRRERALAFAMAIPVKLVFPLIVCFLPGIFVAALGPMVFQIVQTLDAFVRPLAGGGG